MTKLNLHNGWSRIAPGLDVELRHGVPVRVACNNAGQQLNEQHITNRVYALTGLTAAVKNGLNVTPVERELVCNDMTKFDEFLDRQALSSAAIYADRFHDTIHSNTVEWIDEEYSFDFNLTMGTLLLKLQNTV